MPLPDKNERVDAVSAARKLVGNGNGMQFFGTMLIRSELTLEQLHDYYTASRKKDRSYIVERQAGNEIDFIDHGDLIFKELPTDEARSDYYIVYTWGSSNYPLSDLNLRGH
ncbi:hypothetical protein [Paenibacillus methanolicus]|uniref:hypothetical protein n=1 Tax=Paenibacillus methanolicus TaxID=582686 RepID=UPI0011E73A04|nr:hypothetical protein [Paenibacillus methanolicus]